MNTTTLNLVQKKPGSSGATTVTVNQEAGGGTWSSLGTFSFNAGSATVSLTDQANGYVIADAVMLLPPGSGPNTASWTPNVPAAGQYEVFARWTQLANRATNAAYTVTHAGGTTQVAVNQQVNGGAWNSLGTFTLSPGTAHKVTLTDQANGYVIADAIRLVPVSIPTGPQYFAMHADHLNTPRLVADATGTTVWRWDQAEPFGNNPADENPSGLGAFDLPLRLPGQRYDAETGLHYNYFRDFDPSLGIYKQSDPIGLEGGANTYAYALQNPLSFMDEWGLLTSITVWQPVGWSSSSAGHVSTNINGTTYSFAGNGMTIMPTPKYLAANQFRQGVSMTLALSPQQEAELENCLKRNQGSYNLISNNCGAPPQSCLALVGVNVGFAMAPTSIGNNILNSSALRGVSILPATQPITGISAPWTR